MFLQKPGQGDLGGQGAEGGAEEALQQKPSRRRLSLCLRIWNKTQKNQLEELQAGASGESTAGLRGNRRGRLVLL